VKSPEPKKIVIIGATSAIAQQCARMWASNQFVDLTLVCRDSSRTQRLVEDLTVRSPDSRIQVVESSFTDPAAITTLINGFVAAKPIDMALIAHGSLPDQSDCQANLQSNADALTINGTSPVLFAEAIVGHMQRANHGTLGIIGSVAGDRGRKSNYVYGAAKGLVTRYAQGLQHRLASSNVKVVLIKPGPTDTPMTATLKAKDAKLASVESVAQDIVHGMSKGTPVVYTPGKWALIMMVIRFLPRFVFNKMDI
jgi:decaprenylphospho-beta-D-erythro-pentofuranosid-2-ulose 2-reductase